MRKKNGLAMTGHQRLRRADVLNLDPPPKIQLLTSSDPVDPYRLFTDFIAAGRTGLCLTKHTRQELNRRLPLENVRLHFLRDASQSRLRILPWQEILALFNGFMDQTPTSAILFDGVDELVEVYGQETVRSILVKLWTHALFHDTRIVFSTDTPQVARPVASIVQHFSHQAAVAHGSLQTRVGAGETTVRLWLEHANDVIMILDLDGNFAYLNARAEEISARPREHWLGRHFSAMVAPEDLPLAMQSLHRSLLGEREVVEIRLRGSDGREVTLSLSTNPVYEEGVLTGLLCIGRDMTRWNEAQDKIRRRSEQLSTLYGISTALTQSLDLDRVLHECLLRILALLHIDGAKIRLWDQLRKRPGEVRASVGLDDPDYEPYEIHESPASGQIVVDSSDARQNGFVTRVSVENGSQHGGSASTTYHYLTLRAKGQLVGVLCLVAQRRFELQRDEQNLLQSIATQIAIAIENALLFEELKRKTEEAAAHNSELEDFVRIASHDLRSPLVSVQGFVEAFVEEFGETIPPKGRDFLNRALRNTIQMQQLLGRLQELTQARHGMYCIEKVDLNLLVREIVSVLEPKMRQQKVSLDIHSLPTLEADPVRLRQLFLNLMDNAVKYSPGDRATKVEIGYANGIFYIRDQGCGIPKEHQESVFRPMVRLARDGEGTGMGLAIVQRVVENHGGRIWLESEPGKGTTFFFTLSPQVHPPPNRPTQR
jgi:PAS domain S-box-containing protein